MAIEVNKDGEGFLAKICGRDNLYAFGYSEDEALQELENVVDMVMKLAGGQGGCAAVQDAK